MPSPCRLAFVYVRVRVRPSRNDGADDQPTTSDDYCAASDAMSIDQRSAPMIYTLYTVLAGWNISLLELTGIRPADVEAGGELA